MPLRLPNIFRRAVAIAALLAALCAHAAAQNTVTGAINGAVVIGDTMEPAVGAMVTITNQATGVPVRRKTDVAGRFYQGLLSPGIYVVRAEKEGYEPVEAELKLFATMTNSVAAFPLRLFPKKSHLLPATTPTPSPGGKPTPTPVSTPSAPRDLDPPTIEITSPKPERGLSVGSATSKITVTGRAEDLSGINEVLVQDVPAELDEQGNFSAEVRLRVGENLINVVAVDLRGNRGTRDFTLRRASGAVAAPASAAPAAPGAAAAPAPAAHAYHALVIGNNQYLSMPRLKTAEKDAAEVAATLREQYGFETKLLLNADRKKILSTLFGLRQQLDANASLVIYYAGHGYKDEEAGTAYWLPVDASEDDPSNWISAEDVTRGARAIPATHILVVSDSCYSGAMTREMSGGVSPAATRQEFLQKSFSRRSRHLMSSGGNEPVADEGGGGHSVFAGALLRALRQIKLDAFTGRELFNELQESVAGNSQQLPEYKYLHDSGHDGGDFIFRRKKQ